MSETDPLGRLTGMSAEDFAARHWATAPLLRRAADLPGGGFTDLLSPDAVDELVSTRGLRTPFLRMARDGSVRPTSTYTGPGGAGAEIGDQVADDKLLAELAAGSTLVLQGLHRTWPPVVDLAGALARQLGHPVQVNAYLTPAQNTGFDPHYDVHDVFVLQFTGRKRWRVHAPVLDAPLRDQPWQDRRAEVAARATEEPVIETVLEPGDVLYLPRGYLHSASALGELSGHLTIGVQPVTRAALAARVLDLVGDDVELRRSLPMGVDLGDPDVLAGDLKATRDALHAAVDRLDDADVVSAIAASLGRHLSTSTRPAPLGPLAQLAAADRVSADDVVVLRPGLRCSLGGTGDREGTVRLRLPGKSLSLPERLTDAAARAVTGEPVRVADLGLEVDDAAVLVRRLLLEGVVVPA
ncbi:cupin domain-containing protein [uncultured Nocardioides sp.]|uniref:cupin domain-containing protein n=1 Tax=uncultured Nocardioides sp. TaxID=198441 RepID=UPI002617BA13|nr:cupin domain-containing protein [uncultured Nocardioides sp.]